MPDEPAVLLLSFSTPLMSLADSLTDLFLAMAGSLQWRRGQVHL